MVVAGQGGGSASCESGSRRRRQATQRARDSRTEGREACSRPRGSTSLLGSSRLVAAGDIDRPDPLRLALLLAATVPGPGRCRAGAARHCGFGRRRPAVGRAFSFFTLTRGNLRPTRALARRRVLRPAAAAHVRPTDTRQPHDPNAPSDLPLLYARHGRHSHRPGQRPLQEPKLRAGGRELHLRARGAVRPASLIPLRTRPASVESGDRLHRLTISPLSSSYSLSAAQRSTATSRPSRPTSCSPTARRCSSSASPRTRSCGPRAAPVPAPATSTATRARAPRAKRRTTTRVRRTSSRVSAVLPSFAAGSPGRFRRPPSLPVAQRPLTRTPVVIPSR